MSDYLGNLAARSLNLIEAIQPRLASRFEAPTAFAGPASTQHIGAEPMAEAPTLGEIDLSLQTLDQPPARLLVEHPPAAPPSVAELQRLPLAAAQRTADGLTTTAVLSSAQPTHQQPSLPAQDLLPPVKIGSAQPRSQSTSDPTRPASLQAPLSMLQPAVAQPSTKNAPQQPDPDRSTRLLPAERDGRGAAFPGRTTEQENQPKLEPAPRPIVVERLALQQEPRPAGTEDGTAAVVSRRAVEQENQPRPKPAPSPSVIERIALRQEPQPTGARDGSGVALLQSTAQQERWSIRPVSIQRIDFEGIASPIEPPLTVAARPALPAIQDVPSPILAPIVARPQVVPYVKPTTPLTPSEPTVAPEPAPTIQVTIGRIEVRATPPPSPAPRRQRTATPVMSLDEYLRQRARGGGG